MNKITLPIILIMSALLMGNAPKPARGATSQAGSERGRYLVESVAMCVQCHSRRDGRGDLIRSQLLKGATVPVSNPFPDRPWAEFAPRIAGLPQYTDDQARRLLTEGIARTGQPLRSPMPPFRLSDQDAREIIAYLRSLE